MLTFNGDYFIFASCYPKVYTIRTLRWKNESIIFTSILVWVSPQTYGFWASKKNVARENHTTSLSVLV